MEDLDQRISDLRTVENWLNMNLAMLRNTIQALEVQRATIATLQSLSSTMANTMQGITDTVTGESEKKDDAEEPASPLIAQSAAWWQGVQDQFKQALGAALEGAAAASTVPPAKTSSPAAKKAPRKTTAAKRSSSARTATKSPSKRKSV